ncbi:unnamed protein product [Cyclocybe aegerita]|uniref:Hydrophobin n=1 Tax=Cyclocybe aegerita TaxID=1973307 RepID=A0A8S0WJQ2_CYCAE|nr:unnamed protein product [Cyclocybe aegerita]
MNLRLLSATLALAHLAVATPTPRDILPPAIPASQCNAGNLQCCDTAQSANSPAVAIILALLGIVVPDVTAAVGLTCTPISVIGVGGDSCTAQPVCCASNSFNGLVAFGCTPVNLNL